MTEDSSHPAFPEPEDKNIRLWRYLDIYKFEWLAGEKRIYMPNADHLGDPLEGTQPLGHDDWWASLAAAATSDAERENIEHNRQLLSQLAAAFRTRYYVSCWHMNADENPTMWDRYTTLPESVAIRTTFAKLRAALPAYIDIGKVRYIDYATDRLPTLNIFEYITHKNKCFQYEQEIRAVTMHPVVKGAAQQHFHEHYFQTERDPARRVYAPPIELPILVEAVILHPSASDAFAARVTSLCNDSHLPLPHRSAS